VTELVNTSTATLDCRRHHSVKSEEAHLTFNVSIRVSVRCARNVLSAANGAERRRAASNIERRTISYYGL